MEYLFLSIIDDAFGDTMAFFGLTALGTDSPFAALRPDAYVLALFTTAGKLIFVASTLV